MHLCLGVVLRSIRNGRCDVWIGCEMNVRNVDVLLQMQESELQTEDIPVLLSQKHTSASLRLFSTAGTSLSPEPSRSPFAVSPAQLSSREYVICRLTRERLEVRRHCLAEQRKQGLVRIAF